MSMGEISLQLLLLVVAITVFLPVIVSWLVVPFLLKRRSRLRERPDVVPIEPGGLPAEFKEYLQSLSSLLAEKDFVHVAMLFWEEKDPSRMRQWLSVWMHHRHGDAAIAWHVRVDVGSGRSMSSSSLSYQTPYPDDYHIVTDNSENPGAIRGDSMIDTLICMGLSDPGVLYTIHRARVCQLRPDSTPLQIETSEDVVDSFLRTTQLERRRRLGRGTMRFHKAKGEYRYTWRGALMTAWKEAWPVPLFRKILHRQRVKHVLRSLGFGEAIRLLAPFPWWDLWPWPRLDRTRRRVEAHGFDPILPVPMNSEPVAIVEGTHGQKELSDQPRSTSP